VREIYRRGKERPPQLDVDFTAHLSAIGNFTVKSQLHVCGGIVMVVYIWTIAEIH
jgi:hypothetical protein